MCVNILVIIPARGNSKGIPRKNMKSLNGKPLIYYSISCALRSKYDLDVYVSSEDEEILTISKRFGANVYKRPLELSGDSITLEPVVYDAFINIERMMHKRYDYIVTLQPTSPLLETDTLDNAISYILNNDSVDVLLSARVRRHLTWKRKEGKFKPNYDKRENRQYIDPLYEETGAFVICRRNNLEKYKTRFVGNVDIYVLEGSETIDIDTFEDWAICEYFLKKKKILFVVIGNQEFGLGHTYRSLVIANSIVNHDVYFLVPFGNDLCYKIIKSYNFTAYNQKNKDIIIDIKDLSPDVVVNDVLDTPSDYILALKEMGIKVINFEDLGDGSRYADLVINALYGGEVGSPNYYCGYKYFVARDEFIYQEYKEVGEEVNNVFICYGGVDVNNYTLKTLDAIYDYCVNSGMTINVVLGLGYNNCEKLRQYEEVNIYNNIRNISEFIYEADIIFTSAGRTVYEVACIGTPAIVLAQNDRELKHYLASPKFGFINLGLGTKISNDVLFKTFVSLCNDFLKRKMMSEKMLSIDLRSGRHRVIRMIKNILEG